MTYYNLFNSVAGYCVLCGRGVEWLNHSLPFACI